MNADYTEAWEINHRVNMKLLDALDEGALDAVYAPRVRNVGKVFAHLHNVRLMWLEVALPKAIEGVPKFGREAETGLEVLKSAHAASAEAMLGLWAKIAETGKAPGFKRSPQSFFSYVMAHEAHHRGQIMAALRVSGHKLPKDLTFGLWEWDKL